MDDNRRRLIVVGGLIALLVLLPFVVVAVRIASDLRSRAGIEGSQPQSVVFSNLTSSSITVSYTTIEAVSGQATASGGTSGIVTGLDTRDSQTPGSYKVHYIIINNLLPNTNYEVSITSGGQSFTDASWQAKTTPIDDQLGTPDSVTVSISPAVSEAVIYAIAGNSAGNSTVASSFASQSNATIQKNNLLTLAGQRITSFSDKDILLFVDGGAVGRGRVQFAGTLNNAPSVTLTDLPIIFDPNQRITVGSTGGVTPPPTNVPASTPVSAPVTPPINVDQVSKGLLTQLYSTGAELQNPIAPYNIFLSNISPTGFTVNWLTKEPTIGYIEIVQGSTRTQLADNRDGTVAAAKKRFTHSVRAEDGSITANTLINFQIISNGVAFGKNITTVSDDYNRQFKEFANLFILNTQNGEPILGAGSASAISNFVYVPSVAASTDLYAVATPRTPSSAPLPTTLQGSVNPAISASSYQTALQASADLTPLGTNTYNPNSPKLIPSAVDSERDYIVLAKTANSLWASNVPTSTLAYSLSLGSTLNDSQNNYIEVTGSTSLSIRLFGNLNQSGSREATYTSQPVALTLEAPGALLSMLHATVSGSKILTGQATAQAQITIRNTTNTETATVTNSSYWQINSKLIAAGLNELEFDFGNNNRATYLFVFSPATQPDLPATAIPQEISIILIGAGLLCIGFALRRKYLVVK